MRAAASAFQRHLGIYTVSLEKSALDVINTHPAGLLEKFLVDHDLEFAGFENFVIVFRLIQSQAQLGPCSAISQMHPKSTFHSFIIQEFLKLFACRVTHFHHAVPRHEYREVRSSSR